MSPLTVLEWTAVGVMFIIALALVSVVAYVVTHPHTWLDDFLHRQEQGRLRRETKKEQK